MGESSPQPSRRIQRIANRIKFLVSHVIRAELSDPRIGLVTVLDVKPTEDLKEATVYVSVFGSAGDRSKTEKALRGAMGFIQGEVARNLETRNSPVLRLVFSDEQEKVSRIEALIRKVSQEDQGSTMAKKPSKKPIRTPREEEKPAKKPSKKGRAVIDEDDQPEDPDGKDDDNEEEEEEEEEDTDQRRSSSAKGGETSAEDFDSDFDAESPRGDVDLVEDFDEEEDYGKDKGKVDEKDEPADKEEDPKDEDDEEEDFDEEDEEDDDEDDDEEEEEEEYDYDKEDFEEDYDAR